MALQEGGRLWEHGGQLSSHLSWPKALGHVCRCTVLFVPLPGGCCDTFILFLSCVNCGSLVVPSSDDLLELAGYKKWWPSWCANCSAGLACATRGAEPVRRARDAWVPQGQISSGAASSSCVASMPASLPTQERVAGTLLAELSLHMGDVCARGVR